ncbi:MAG: AlkA N-terminal domain-containing protein [Candidatus Acidiferrum sp.]
MEALAEKLGVGSRHLRRLFLRHLGATPSAVAQTGRLHFAKKLIDETKLPMVQVALASGFGCVRRFNAAIRNVYHRTPTEIRTLARRTEAQPENHYLFRLDFRPPYNWKRVLQFLDARATPGVESVEAGGYRRSFSLNNKPGQFEVSLDGQNNALAVRVQFGEPRSLFFIIERIRAMFDLNPDWAVIARALGTDPGLARRVETEKGLRVPGCWNGFELTTHAILGQRSSVARATSLVGRMVRAFGQQFTEAGSLIHYFPAPEALAHANLTSIGLGRECAETIRVFARAVYHGQLQFEELADSDGFLKRLCGIPGIEKRTAQYVAMRDFRDPDAFPAGDPVLRRIACVRTERELESRSDAWRPWRAYAAMLLRQSAGDVAPEAPASVFQWAPSPPGPKGDRRPPRVASSYFGSVS